MSGRLDAGLGDWTSPKRNLNRGYRKLDVWQDAMEYYRQSWNVFSEFPYVARRIASNQIAAVDSVHRNLAEGYCRRSIREYLQFLNVALSSAGESVSALHAYLKAGQLSRESFDKLDAISYKLENGLIRLIESLEKKRDDNDWDDSFMIRESNTLYRVDEGQAKS